MTAAATTPNPSATSAATALFSVQVTSSAVLNSRAASDGQRWAVVGDDVVWAALSDVGVGAFSLASGARLNISRLAGLNGIVRDIHDSLLSRTVLIAFADAIVEASHAGVVRRSSRASGPPRPVAPWATTDRAPSRRG